MSTILEQFLDVNSSCPCCQKPLQLYMQVLDGTLWKTNSLFSKDSKYIFEPINAELGNADYFMMENGQFDFTTCSLQQQSKTWQLFFFVMCSSDTAIDTTNIKNCSINSYEVCYYRSSQFLEFVDQGNKNWQLKLIMQDNDPLIYISRNEIFVVKDINQGLEKIYLLDFDYEADQSILRYYSMSQEEKASNNFEPKIFKKELPLMNTRPDFSDRNLLLDRLSSWVNLS